MPLEFDHDAARDHIDAWALGALDVEDTAALEAHLAGCVDCTRAAAAALDDADRLGFAVPLVAASPVLKSRIMASAAALDRGAPRTQPPARMWWAAAAAAVLFAAGAAAWGGYLQHRVNDLQSQNDRVTTAASAQSAQLATAQAELVQATSGGDASDTAFLEIATAPDLARLQMVSTSAAPDAAGRYVWSRTSGLGALVATHLPALDTGKAYCLWIVYENAWVSGGLFQPGADGTGHIIVRDVDGTEPDHGALRGFAVTIEPSGATPEKHSGPTILQASMN